MEKKYYIVEAIWGTDIRRLPSMPDIVMHDGTYVAMYDLTDDRSITQTILHYAREDEKEVDSVYNLTKNEIEDYIFKINKSNDEGFYLFCKNKKQQRNEYEKLMREIEENIIFLENYTQKELENYLGREIDLVSPLKITLQELYNLEIPGVEIQNVEKGTILVCNNKLKIDLEIIDYTSCAQYNEAIEYINKLQKKYNIKDGDLVEEFMAIKLGCTPHCRVDYTQYFDVIKFNNWAHARIFNINYEIYYNFIRFQIPGMEEGLTNVILFKYNIDLVF